MRVLHIEDDNFIAELYGRGLKAKGLVVDRVADTSDALAALDAMRYDAIVLDLNLPDADGLTFLETIRRRKILIPVIVISARNTLQDKVRALTSGADDYVAKPIQLEELAARLYALMRRPRLLESPELRLGNMTFIPSSKSASVDGQKLQLSRRETLLLFLLLNHIGRPLTREVIGDRLYAFGEEVASNAVEVMIFRLRARLRDAGATVKIISSRGIGYTLEADSGPKPRAAQPYSL